MDTVENEALMVENPSDETPAGSPDIALSASEDALAGGTPLKLFGTATDSIVDGPGLRCSVFVQGCSHHCPGCHNVKSQETEGGIDTTAELLAERILALKGCKKVTFSGGEPFEQPVPMAVLARILKSQGFNIWMYSGYLYEDLLAQAQRADDSALDEAERARCAGIRDMLELGDVLVDGPFILEKKSLDLLYRGSSNQRLIDLAASRRAGRVVLWQTFDSFPTKPESW